MEKTVQRKNIHCKNEFDPLGEVLLCRPTHMAIKKVINRVQAKYEDENIDVNTALAQHDDFAATLKNEGIHVHYLQTDANLPEQVFTRDIGFAIHDQFVIATLKKDIRKREKRQLEKWFIETGRPYIKAPDDLPIEGGDVLLHGDQLYVGDSDRTSRQAIDWLQDRFPNLAIHSIPFQSEYLHLDCVFNIVSDEDALIYPPALSREAVRFFNSRYNCIEVTADEQFQLAVNVCSIGRKKIIGLPQNRRVNDELRARGYDVIEVDLSEIIKSGGSFRCITLPLYRQPS